MTQHLHLRGLHQSGATDGQAPLWSDAADAYVPGDVGSGGGGALRWFHPLDYGAVGDRSTDDTGAWEDCIDALNAAGRGVLYCGSTNGPGYKITSTLPSIDVPATVFGDGCADSHFRQAATSIDFTSATGVLFTVGADGHGTTFDKINLENIAGSTPSAGAALQVLGGDGAHYSQLTIRGFWINMDMQDGQEWTMEDCFLYSPVKYGMKLQHIDLPDGGDMGITNCQFLSGDYDADAAIRFQTAGGLRLTNCKINARTLTHKFARGLDIDVTANTGVLVVGDCSIENVTGNAIRGRESGGSFQAAVINGLEIAYYAPTTVAAIDIDGWADVTIDAITALAQSGGSSGPVVKLANVTNARVGVITNDGFATEMTQTSCTNVVPLSGPLTVQDENSNVSTAVTQVDFQGAGVAATSGTGEVVVTIPGYTDEQARDALGTALVAGTNVTVTVDDAGDTITIAASSLGAGELLMQDAVTGPPVPIETEARDDWLYQG